MSIVGESLFVHEISKNFLCIELEKMRGRNSINEMMVW
jgi:hypothetical protein